jgi:hypothetical protein
MKFEVMEKGRWRWVSYSSCIARSKSIRWLHVYVKINLSLY